jgi:hypothetical protein
MRYDRTEIENYVYGSDLWAGLHDRILVAGVNDREFWSDLFEGRGGKSFKKNLDCPENRLTLIEKYQELNPNEPIIRSYLNDLMHKLLISGNPCFIYPHLEPEAPPDERPRDSQGRIMSPKAIQWREWEQWCSSLDTKMADIQNLRRTNPDFAEFYHTTAERQRVTDDTKPNTTPSKKAIPADVLRFAQEYRTLSTQQVKTLLSAGLNPLGPAAAAEAKRLFDAACACGAI